MKNIFLLLLSFFFLNTQISAQVFINEVAASNASINADPDFSAYSDWVELYNAGATSVNLSGYSLTDNLSDTLKWTFPAGTTIGAKGYLLVWCDAQNTGLHTSYSLTKTGEEIGLYNTKKQLLDGFTFAAQEVDVSYGRKTDGGALLSFFTKPTPNASNNNSTAYDGFTFHEPIFNHSGGFYNNSVSLLIENLDKIGTIHYTLDGSVPTSASPIFTTALMIAQTTVVKAALIENGRIDGPIITNTYFINEKFDQRKLPVVSLSTEPKYFWAPAIGLYVQTFKPTWEYPIHIEFYEPDGLLGFHHDAGIKVDGENSWILPQKLLSIFSRKKYGASKIEYQIFPDNPRKEYENIILRCSGNDWSNTLFRDGMEQSLSTTNNKDIDIQDFRPCIVFINGKYLGVHNLRSREDEEFIKLKYGIKSSELDLIENDGVVKTGNNIAYNTMTSQLTNGVQNDADFQKLATIMDVPNYTDYIQNELFCANTSWGHNISCYRAQQDSAKFRWLSFDFDRGFFMDNVNGVAMDFFTTTTGASWSNPSSATLWLRQMLKNTNYKAQFISRFADHLYTTYHPTNINNRVDLFSNKIRAEMPTQIERWKGTTSSYGDAMPSVAYWENEVSLLKQYGVSRNAFLQKELSTYFNLSGDTGLDLDVTNRNHGSIKIHECNVPSYPWSGRYLNNVPIRLTAIPKTGFKFIRWKKSSSNSQDFILSGSKWAYYDEATAAPSNWNSPSATLAWKEGNAEFGYGEGDEATVISFGSDANNKPITSYYRQNFNVTDITGLTALTMRLKIDDGAVVYLNGKEVARFNMPTGAVAFSTIASSSISPENTWNDIALAPSSLLKGNNLLAVEVHQYAANSSDVTFDAQLLGAKGNSYTSAGTNSVLDFSLNNVATAYRAVFEPTGECFLPDTIFQNMTLTAACSPYKAQGTVVVKPNVTLTVEQGVEVQFPQQANMWVLGNIVLQGTQNQGITITKTVEATQWGGIFLNNTTDTCRMNYVTIKNASSGLQRMLYPAAISGYHTTLRMDHLTITETFDNPIFL
jgi:CotH kinase protein/Lamin Tail Domain/Fn3 associated